MNFKMIALLLIVVTFSCVSSAAEIRWAADNMPDFFPTAKPDGINWELADNWFNVNNVLTETPPYWTVPTVADSVYIDSQANPGVFNETMPILSSVVDNISKLHLGHNFAGQSSLDLLPVPGAYLVITETRLGHYIDSVGTLNLQGGTLATNLMQVGFNSSADNAGGSGVINMSGNCVLHTANLEFGQQNPDYDPLDPDLNGTGLITMTENARLIVNGDQTVFFNDAINDGLIQTVHPCETLVLVSNYDTEGALVSTEINVLKASAYSDMDFNYDCIVDENDFVEFVEQWLDDKN